MVDFVDFKRKYRQYNKEISSAINRVFKRGWFISGPEVQEFEHNFSKYLGVKHVVAVNSGTDALTISLKAAGIKKGDQVITTSHTATPTISAIRMTGAVPVFADIDPISLVIDPESIKKKIKPKIKAIMPVHLYGYPVDMEAIRRISAKYRLIVIEDACQAHGGKFNGKFVGTIGDAGGFSFYPTKNLGAFGDGGAIATNNEMIAHTAVMMRNYGEASKFNNEIEGVNSRLDELQAALLNWQLKKLDQWNRNRSKIAEYYLSQLSGLPLILPPRGSEQFSRVWHLFVIQSEKRDELMVFLKKNGIGTMIHYPTPVFRQKAFRFLHYQDKDLPITAAIADKIISLPLYPELKMSEAKIVCQKIKAFFKNNG